MGKYLCERLGGISMDEQKLQEIKDELMDKIDEVKQDVNEKVDGVKESFEETYHGTGWGNYFFRGVVLFLLVLIVYRAFQ